MDVYTALLGNKLGGYEHTESAAIIIKVIHDITFLEYHPADISPPPPSLMNATYFLSLS